jgi:hypothetical protein
MRFRALLFAGLLVALSLIAAPANAAGKPVRDVADYAFAQENNRACGFRVDIVAEGKSITLDFGDRKIILLPGTKATLTNPATGTSVRVAIPGPEFDGPLNPDDSPAIFTATGPWLWLAFDPATGNAGLFLTYGRVVINNNTGGVIEASGRSRDLCAELA